MTVDDNSDQEESLSMTIEIKKRVNQSASTSRRSTGTVTVGDNSDQASKLHKSADGILRGFCDAAAFKSQPIFQTICLPCKFNYIMMTLMCVTLLDQNRLFTS